MLKNKKILVMGVANERSIAWGIAKGIKEQGGEVILTYPNEAIQKRIVPLAEELGAKVILPCDVQSDEQINALFESLKKEGGALDGFVHAMAFAPREDLQCQVSGVSRAGFASTMDISVYSLLALARGVKELMPNGGSILTLTYLGSERVVTNYNLMGIAKAGLEAAVRYLAAELGQNNIRVNAISSGPVKTLASSAIPEFKKMLNAFAEIAPLRRNTSLEDLAGAAIYFLSSLSSGVTGEISYVDGGYNVVDAMR